MKRYALQNLVAWKNSKNRKPLLLYGARQVGKTWLMEEFGKTNFSDYVAINVEKNERIANVFNNTLNPQEIVTAIEMEARKKVTKDTLIIIDEIQACPRAITSLKYFCEDLPEYHVIAAGSLLGVAIHQGISFPVGKVESMYMYPMTFCEFLDALGEEKLCELINSSDFQMINLFKDKIITYLKTYFYVGGMPEVVKNYIENKDFQEVREIQNRILSDYKQDFSHHIPPTIRPQVTKLWDSIPRQLAKENKKFVYSEIENTKARVKEYDPALEWLKDSGLVYQIMRLSKPALPIKAYQEYNNFKLFLSDIIFKYAQNILKCDCAQSCNKCILQNDTKYNYRYLDRKLALEFLTDEWIAKNTLPQDMKIFGDGTLVASASIESLIEDTPNLQKLYLIIPENMENEDFSNSPIYRLVNRYNALNTQIILCVNEKTLGDDVKKTISLLSNLSNVSVKAIPEKLNDKIMAIVWDGFKYYSYASFDENVRQLNQYWGSNINTSILSGYIDINGLKFNDVKLETVENISYDKMFNISSEVIQQCFIMTGMMWMLEMRY